MHERARSNSTQNREMHCLQCSMATKPNSFELFSQIHRVKEKGGDKLSLYDLTLCVPARNFTCSYSCLTIRKTEGENGKGPENSKNDQRAGEADT